MTDKLDQKHLMGLLYLDSAKAFDIVLHERLGQYNFVYNYKLPLSLAYFLKSIVEHIPLESSRWTTQLISDINPVFF